MQGTAGAEADRSAGLTLRTITLVEPGERSGTVRVRFDDGLEADIDLSALIRPGTVLADLSDTSVFRAVQLGPRGRSLEWPGGVELCADALWLRAAGQSPESCRGRERF